MDDVAFDEAEFRQLVDGPEPSWMDRLTTLSNAMGRHPLYKDIDRGVSSETDVQEEGDGVGREIARRKEAGAAGGGQKSAESISKAVGSATKSASKPQGAKDKGQSRPAPPTLPPSTKAVSRSTRPAPPARPNNAMAVDDTTPAPRQVPETNANAVASTSRLPPPRRPTPIRSAASNPLAKRSTSPPTPASETTPLSSPALPRPSFLPPPANASVIIDVFSASEDEAEASPPRKKAKRRSSTVRAESSKVLLARQASKAKLLSPTKGARGSTGSKKKARVSLEAEIAKLKTSAGVKRFKEIQTVSAYVEHLAQFELDAKGSLPLAGTRVIFVNADHWLPARVAPRRSSSSSSARPLRNRLDPTLRHQVEIAVKQGATLVKPEDFVPPPFDVESEPFDAAQAEREGWTTHIIPFTPSTKQVPVRNATFTEMLSCLGPDVGGIEQDDLGPYVKVVGFGWVSNSVEARGRAVEFPNLISGDFREAAKAISAKDVQRKKEMQERRRKSELEEKKRKAEDAENTKRSGRGRKDEQEDTDEDEEMSDGEGGPPQGISYVFSRLPSPLFRLYADLPSVLRRPFGENDFPLGEKPAVAQLDESTSIDPSASSSHPSKRPRTRSPVPPNDEQTGHTSSDPIVDPDQTGRLSPSLGKEKSRSPKGKSRSPADNNDDLQNELAMIKEHGVDVVDQYLDAADKGEGWVTTEKDVDDGFKIMADWAEEDNETDEENEWEERKRRGEVKGERKGFNPNARIRRAKVRRLFFPDFLSESVETHRSVSVGKQVHVRQPVKRQPQRSERARREDGAFLLPHFPSPFPSSRFADLTPLHLPRSSSSSPVWPRKALSASVGTGRPLVSCATTPRRSSIGRSCSSSATSVTPSLPRSSRSGGCVPFPFLPSPRR